MPEPVSLSLAKKHMRIDDDYTYDDDLIELYITSNREWMEKQLNLSLVPKTGLKQKYNRGCYCGEPNILYVNYGPVTNFAIAAKDDTALVLDSTYWNTGTDDFPVIYAQQDALITYDAGYDETTIPSALKDTLLMLVAANYQQREGFLPDRQVLAIQKMSPFSRNLYL